MPKAAPLPDQELLKELFDYEMNTGILRWRVSRAQRRAGDIAGSLKREGYWVVGLNNRSLKVHRVIWKLVTGNDPSNEIDHIDLNRSNNKWDNLREATSCQNMQNRHLHSNSTSGIKGVSYNKNERKWDAYIMADKKFTLLGRFKDRETAASIVAEARSKLHGAFARAS